MENMWTKINDDIPKYLKDIASQYNMKFVKVSSLKTALVGKDFIILIFIDRFSANVSYIMREDKSELVLFQCDNYFAERYDQEDRRNLVLENGAESLVVNNLIVINNGLISKWNNVLKGDIDWLEEYKKSEWFEKINLDQVEEEKLSQYI